jgi:hypothetical protein
MYGASVVWHRCPDRRRRQWHPDVRWVRQARRACQAGEL